MSTTGSFTTAAPLAANLSDEAIGPGADNLVTSWSFNDGIQTYTELNSQLFQGDSSYSFVVSTDAAGAITAYQIIFISPKGTNTVGELMDSIAIISIAGSGGTQAAVNQLPCATVSNGYCAGITGSIQAVSDTAGTFVIKAVASTESTPAPTLSPMWMVFLVVSVAAIGFRKPRLSA